MYAVREVEKELDRRDKFENTWQYEFDFDIEHKSDKVRLIYKMMHLAFLNDTTRVITYLTQHDGYNGPHREIGISEGHLRSFMN